MEKIRGRRTEKESARDKHRVKEMVEDTRGEMRRWTEIKQILLQHVSQAASLVPVSDPEWHSGGEKKSSDGYHIVFLVGTPEQEAVQSSNLQLQMLNLVSLSHSIICLHIVSCCMEHKLSHNHVSISRKLNCPISLLLAFVLCFPLSCLSMVEWICT